MTDKITAAIIQSADLAISDGVPPGSDVVRSDVTFGKRHGDEIRWQPTVTGEVVVLLDEEGE